MSGLIKKLKVSHDSTELIEDAVPLEELLAEELDRELDTPSPVVEDQSTSAQPATRKSRRKKIRSNRVVAKKAMGRQADKEQRRKSNVYQERNKRALLARQKQAKQKGRISSDKVSSQGNNKVSSKSSGSQKIDTVKRPVVLACADFKPCYDDRKDATPSGKLLTIKRAVRRLNIDKQVKLDIKNTTFPNLPIAKALKDYSRSRKRFLKSLDPSTMLMYKDALSAFGLTIEDNVSNTEMIFTLVKEYANALQLATPRLDESPLRSVDQDEKLVRKNSFVYERLSEAFFGRSSHFGAWKQYSMSRQSDKELELKCLISFLAKEILYSYNIQKNPDALDRDFPKEMGTRLRKSVLTNPQEMDSNTGAQGVVFSDQDSSPGSRLSKTICYPFESSEVINDQFTTKSAIHFLKELTNKEQPNKYKTSAISTSYSVPYEAIAASYDKTCGDVSTLLDASNLEFGESIYLGLFNTILSGVLTNVSKARSSSSDSIQCEILRIAAADSEVMGMLLVYLAFRSEKLFASEDELPAVELLLKNSMLRDYVGRMSKGKTTKTFTVNPQKIDLDPGIDGQKSFSAPDRAQTATLESEPSDFEKNTLEDKFDVGFDSLCQGFAARINNKIDERAKSAPSFTAFSEVSVGLNTVYDTLSDLSSQDSLFDYLLRSTSVLDSALPTGDSDATSIFNPNMKTVFNNSPERNMFMAFTIAVCDVILLMTSGRTSASTSARVSISSGTGKIKQRKMKAQLMLPKGKSGRGSSSSKDPTITIDYSADFGSNLSDITSYLNNDEVDFDDLASSNPVLSSVAASLLEEEQFLSSFQNSLLAFFTRIKGDVESIEDSLKQKVNDKDLASLIREGLIPSEDTARILSYLPFSLNQEKTMVYSNTKVFDHTIGSDSMKYLKAGLKEERFLKGGRKVFAIGIPAGLLESTETSPAEISEIRKEARDEESKKYFTIVVQKIDQVRPDVEYEDVQFRFSREFLVLRPLDNVNTIYIDPMADGPTNLDGKNPLPLIVSGDSNMSDRVGLKTMQNTRDDFLLKLWCDLQLDLDFFETAFPNSPSAIKEITDRSVDLSVLSGLDLSSADFLSGSNLAFDPESRKMDNFSFFDSSKNVLSLSKQDSTDPYSASAFDYANTYGSIFNSNVLSKRYSEGLEFERVLCVLIDDDDFKVKDDVLEEGDREINAQMKQQRRSEKAVSIGQPTSFGVDLNTYRFSIVVGDE